MVKLSLLSIRAHLRILVTVMMIVPIVIIIYSSVKQRNYQKKDAGFETARLVSQVSTELTSFTASTELLLGTLSKLPVVQNRNAPAVNTLLSDITKQNPIYSNLIIVDASGLLWASATPFKKPVSYAERRHFKNAMSTGMFSASEFSIGKLVRKPILAFAFPIKDDKQITGVAIASFALDSLQRMLAALKYPHGVSILLIDHKGTILFNAINPEYVGKQDKPELFSRMTAGPDDGTFEAEGNEGLYNILSYRKLRLPSENTPYLYLRVAMNYDMALEQANHDLVLNVAILSSLLLLMLGFAGFISNKYVINKIDALRDASRRFAKGDLEVKVSDRVAGGELGELGLAFDNMVKTLSHDIQERKLVEQRLRDSQKLLLEAQEIAQLGTYVLNADSGEWQSSEILDTIFGIDALYIRDIAGWIDIIHPEDRYMMKDYINEVLIHRFSFEKEYRIVRKNNGETRWVMGLGSLEFNKNGSLFRMIGTIQDITEHKEAEAEKQNLMVQLNQSQKLESIGRLAGGVAHDFNNLLTPIMGYSELLKRNIPADSPDNVNVDKILKAADKARILTQQLLSFGRKQMLAMQTIDMNEVITLFFEILRRTIRESIDIQLNLSQDRYGIRADRNQIEQIIMNLAINAGDAIKDKGVITIDTAPVILDDEYVKEVALVKTGKYLMLVISDTGSGMDQETLSHIYEPFYTTKGIGEGSGLGLATVYGLVKQHDGYIRVFSEVGIGTVFKLYFPIIDEKPEVVTEAAAPEQLVLDAKGSAILLVEDNEMVRNLTNDLLVSHGFTVFAEEGPKQALKLSAGQHIDLLVTDVIMPEMNGPELHQRLLRFRPGLKVLYMSGYTNNVIAQHGVLDEGVNFIQKPFAVDDLAKMVDAILNRSVNQ